MGSRASTSDAAESSSSAAAPGLSVMLRGLKAKPIDITAIVTVADDGGSSGILRQELQIPPPGDIRNVLIALADVEPMLVAGAAIPFHSGNGLAGHSLGNLMLAAMKDIAGDFVTGVRELSQVLAVRGRVLPAAAQAIVLKAEMEDGSDRRRRIANSEGPRQASAAYSSNRAESSRCRRRWRRSARRTPF